MRLRVSSSQVMESIYSLVYALKKFKYDPDCDLFLGCVEKLLPQVFACACACACACMRSCVRALA